LPKARRRRTSRRGTAVVELAVLLPLLLLLFVITVDAARIFHFSLTLQNCARAGALYASDPHVADESPFASVEEAALADAQSLNVEPTITQTSGTDASGHPYVDVTAACTFQTITGFSGIAQEMNLARSVRMRIKTITPDNN
jgi:Flp pilus assembly protein TadG